MFVRHLNCGTMRPLGGRLVDGAGSLFGAARMLCHCLLIETAHRLVLVDTGIGLADIESPHLSLGRTFTRVIRPRLDPEETALRQVTRLGYAADDVSDIVLTHLDLDHAGGLRDFPKAKVHVYDIEYQAAMNPATRLEHHRYSSIQWEHDPNWVVHSSSGGGERWFGFEAVRDLDGLPSEILLVPLSGHTRGHVGVAVQVTSGSGSAGSPRWLLHAGDAYFFHTEIEPAAPRSTPGLALFQTLMQADRFARHRNQARLRELALNYGEQITIFSAHDHSELRSHLQ